MCKKVPGKITDKYNMENLKQASEEIWAQVPPKFFSTILRLVALVYKSFFFFSEQPFYRNYSTLASHTNTVISHAFAYYMPLVKMASKTVTRSIHIAFGLQPHDLQLYVLNFFIFTP